MKVKHKILIYILVGLGFLFLMFGNDIVSLTHPDEVFYIQTAKEMVQRNSWMTPYIFDAPQFEKPVFCYWLFALGIKFFGLTPFVARFWPAFFGMIGVVLTYWIAFLLFHNRRIAFLSGMILTTSFIYIALSRAVLTDMIFSVLVVASLGFFYYGYSYKDKKKLGIILCLTFSGLAVLAKGFLGIVFPFGIILLFLFCKKDLVFLKDKATLWGFLAFLAISVPWHLLMIKLYGKAFVDEYWHNVHVRRIFDAEHQKSNTWYFYLLTIFGGMFPWSFFTLPAGYCVYRKLRRPAKKKEKIKSLVAWTVLTVSAMHLSQQNLVSAILIVPAIFFVYKRLKKCQVANGPLAFLVTWIVFVVFVMQMAQAKLGSYIFPAIFAVAIVIAYYFSTILEKIASRGILRTTKVMYYLMGAVGCVGAVATIVFSKQYAGFVADVRPVYVFSALLFLCGSAIIIFHRLKKTYATLFSIASITGIFLFSVFFANTNAEPWVSCKMVCDVFKEIDRSNSTILCSKFYVRGIRYFTDRKTAVIDSGHGFYSPHPVPYLKNDEEVDAFLRTKPFTYCIVKKSNVEDLERIAAQRGYTITYYEEIGGKYILKIQKKKF